MSHETEARRGQEAQAIVESPLYAESFAAVEAEIIALWRAARDPGDREQLHTMLGLLEKTREALESVIRTGEVASAEIARKQSRAEQIADAAWSARR